MSTFLFYQNVDFLIHMKKNAYFTPFWIKYFFSLRLPFLKDSGENFGSWRLCRICTAFGRKLSKGWRSRAQRERWTAKLIKVDGRSKQRLPSRRFTQYTPQPRIVLWLKITSSSRVIMECYQMRFLGGKLREHEGTHLIKKIHFLNKDLGSLKSSIKGSEEPCLYRIAIL